MILGEWIDLILTKQVSKSFLLCPQIKLLKGNYLLSTIGLGDGAGIKRPPTHLPKLPAN